MTGYTKTLGILVLEVMQDVYHQEYLRRSCTEMPVVSLIFFMLLSAGCPAARAARKEALLPVGKAPLSLSVPMASAHVSSLSGCFHKSGVLVGCVLVIRALLSAGHIRAPVFWKLPTGNLRGSPSSGIANS